MSSLSTESEGQEYLPLIGQSNAVIHNAGQISSGALICLVSFSDFAFAVAASAFFMWDYCITIDAEVELIWRAKWTWITLLFLTIRYLTLANVIVMMVMATNVLGLIHPSQRDCTAWMWFEVISAPVLLMCVETLLIARVVAFYGRNKILLSVLVTLSVCANAARFAVMGVLAPNVKIVQNPLPSNLPFGACLVAEMPSLFSSSWIPEFIPETVLFFLVIFRVIRTKLHSKVATSRVLVVLVRDGSWAFVLIFAGSIWALLQFELTTVLGLIPLSWMVSFLGFCGSRLVLNLRSAVMEPAVPEAFELSHAHQRVSGGRDALSGEMWLESSKAHELPRLPDTSDVTTTFWPMD